jgi:hypothetical protein
MIPFYGWCLLLNDPSSDARHILGRKPLNLASVSSSSTSDFFRTHLINLLVVQIVSLDHPVQINLPHSILFNITFQGTDTSPTNLSAASCLALVTRYSRLVPGVYY